MSIAKSFELIVAKARCEIGDSNQVSIQAKKY